MTKKTCFMIQPFSDPYNKRFENIYKPAIEHVGLIPYRAGGDTVEIITDDIEGGMRNAHICFADITEDNPNVLYEVGYAYACGKPVVMVCNKSVRSIRELPLDIRARSILLYEDVVDFSEVNRDRFVQKIIERIQTKLRKVDSDSTIFPVTEQQSQPSNSLTPLEDRVLREVEEIKKSDSNKTVFSISEQQSQNSGDPLTPLQGEILKKIFFFFLRYESLISSQNIIDQFLGEEEEEFVLLSLDKIKSLGYIEKATNTSDGVVGYHPTEKGCRWCHENLRD